MATDSFWSRIEEVLRLLKEHSERHERPRQAATRPERLSGWASLGGGVIFVGGEVLRQVGDPVTQPLQMTYVAWSILGLVIFMAGAVTGMIETFRRSRYPFIEHVDRVVEALGRERELIYSEIIGLALQRKAHVPKKPRWRFRAISG